MKQNIIKFFDDFVDDFQHFDGHIIASRYLAPYMTISSEGNVVLYETKQDIAQYFSKILSEYKVSQVDHCTYSNFDFSALGKKSFITTVDWHMLRKDNTLVIKWRESYILVLVDEALKIVSSIDH